MPMPSWLCLQRVLAPVLPYLARALPGYHATNTLASLATVALRRHVCRRRSFMCWGGGVASHALLPHDLKLR